ncbi:hypothetical protein CP982_39645 [Streptomyces spectabilis]|uniref:Uncharacterized protein n=1 Tax=Streptomyces spectabilis TaxID=68270 RepID=A0A5P2XHN8_STRST|nr:hypothetical protein CP982_39645 [Streptomyces spectabilis]
MRGPACLAGDAEAGGGRDGGAGGGAGRPAFTTSRTSSAAMSDRTPVKACASRARRQPRDTAQGDPLSLAMRQGMSASAAGQCRGCSGSGRRGAVLAGAVPHGGGPGGGSCGWWSRLGWVSQSALIHFSYTGEAQGT